MKPFEGTDEFDKFFHPDRATYEEEPEEDAGDDPVVSALGEILGEIRGLAGAVSVA